MFIGFVALISKGDNKENTIDTKKLNDVEKISKLEKIEKMHKVQKKKSYKNVSHVWFFVISLLFGFFVWFWLWDIVLHLQLLITVIGSFILFMVFGLLFKFKAFRVREAKIYMIWLIILLAWSAIEMFNIDLSFVDFETKIDNVEMAWSLDTWAIVTWLENSFVPVDEDIVDESLTWEVNLETSYFADEDLDDKATFGDVIKYLIDVDKLELNTKQNIKFTYIPYSSVDYPYYRTAYDQKMIGKGLNPIKNPLCETYIVMKGLIEERSVGAYSDIKLAYWDYAKTNNKLPACEYWTYVRLWDLK